MTNVNTPFNNFARGEIDHDLGGRHELPIYKTGSQAFENFISNFKGNGIFRAGFENMLSFQDSAFLEFRFNQNQNYIPVMYASKMRFLSYDSSDVFGWVLNPSPTIFEVDTPYTLAESKEIAFRKATAQNFDTMIVCHEDHEPYKLIRTAADEFTFRTFSRKDDPFPLTFDSAKTISAITKATEAQLTINTHGYSVNDRFKISSVVGMTEINDWTAAVIEVVDANNVKVDINTTDFTTYTSGGNAEKVLTGDYPSVALYYKGRLYFGASRLKITTIWASEAGNFDIFTLPTTVTDDSALQFTIAEFTSRIESLFAGENSLIAFSSNKVAALNGGDVGSPITAETIDVNITSADGSSNVEPLTKDGFIFYVGNDGRNMFFFNYDLLKESFVAQDANSVAYDITKGGITKMRYVKDRNNLITQIRGDGTLLTVNFNERERIVGWHKHPSEGTFKDIAQITNNAGDQQLFALVLRNGTYYIERQAEYVEFSKRQDFFTDEDSEAVDDEAFYRVLAEELKGCIFLDNSQTLSDLKSTTITYDSGAGTITDVSGPFSSGDVGKHIVYKTKTGYESGRFEITAYNSATEVDVDVLQTPTANSYDSWYLTFDTISGLSRFDGQSIPVVVDGGFLANFTVASGSISLGEQATHAVVGLGYTGLIKSFSLGFQVQAENTQTTMKAVSRVGFRLANSAGIKFGTSRYRLEDVQELGQNDLNFLPPEPVNGTKYIEYVDDNELDKFFYVVQDEPLPAVITSVMIDADYTITK